MLTMAPDVADVHVSAGVEEYTCATHLPVQAACMQRCQALPDDSLVQSTLVIKLLRFRWVLQDEVQLVKDCMPRGLARQSRHRAREGELVLPCVPSVLPVVPRATTSHMPIV
jgi:hypothetical protein